MIGFNYRNLMLQIIQGSVVVSVLIIVFWCKISNLGVLSEHTTTIIFLALLISAFTIGALIDFISDIFESILMLLSKYEPLLTPPIYFLLTKSRWFGISLAHYVFILDNLCYIAARYDSKPENLQDKIDMYKKEFVAKRKLETINYLLQVAKNKAFRECKPYQKDLIESFFILYIFKRNLAMSLLFASLICWNTSLWVSLVLAGLVIISSLASYRYYLYYIRVLLGTTFS